MYGVILAGGSGTRFWPISREQNPKQLQNIVGTGTMIQNTVQRLLPLISIENLRIGTHKQQATETIRQLESFGFLPDHLLAEPCSRNTALIIGLMAKIISADDPDSVKAVIPSDPDVTNTENYVNVKSDYFKTNDDLMDYLENNPLPISYSDGAKYKTEKQKKIISLLKFLITPIDKNLDATYLQYGKTKTNILTKGSRSLQARKRKKIESYMADNLTTKIDSTTPFLYFPLHLEPERELLIQSPFLTNQISVITNISKVLPVNYQLYVKEHPGMRSNGWRSIDYYSNLQNLPNVTLIHPSVNSKELIEKCSLVVTIAGDSALEAAFFNKPSIVFTNTDFSVLPFVFHVEDFKNLKETIKIALDSEVSFDHLKKYISYVNENSFEFDYLTIRADFNNIIYYPGFLGKIDISEDHVKQFIEKLFIAYLSLIHI